VADANNGEDSCGGRRMLSLGGREGGMETASYGKLKGMD